MATNRAGELGAVPERGERFLSHDHGWFFHTREGAVEGPYETKSQADRALGEFLELLSRSTPSMPL